MTARSSALGLLRSIHPAPAAAVVLLSAALSAILAAQAGSSPFSARVVLTVLAVLGSQILTGALNDWADRDRDALVQPTKPISRGQIGPASVLALAGGGLALQVVASLPLGTLALIIGLVAAGSGVAYNLWLSRTPLSVVPYLIGFGLLPLWIAAGVGVPLDRVAAAPVLVGPFAAAAHLANTLRDFDADARAGSRNLAQLFGRRTAFAIAWALALAVGLGVGAVLLLSGQMAAPGLTLGLVGLVAVAQGAAGPHRLWMGMLIAAVCWTASWALASS